MSAFFWGGVAGIVGGCPGGGAVSGSLGVNAQGVWIVMFRPVLAAAVVAVLVSLSGCAGHSPSATGKAAAPAAQSTPDGGTRVDIPAPAGTPTDPTIRGASSATCRADCERSYRICGESDTGSPGTDRLQSLTQPRLFSRADDCRHSLEQCVTRCNKLP